MTKPKKPRAALATVLLLASRMAVAGTSLLLPTTGTADDGSAGDGDAAVLSLDNQIEQVLDDIDNRERRAAKYAQHQAQLEAEDAEVRKLGTEPTPEALAFGRKAAAGNPLNFSLRLRLIDLLSKAEMYEEADKMAAALIAERPLLPVESKRQDNARQRALLKRVRMASDRGLFAYARKLLNELPALNPAPQVTATAKALDTRIVEQQRQAALRAELDGMRTLPPDEARQAVRAAVVADPGKLDLRLLLIDLLAEADLIGEAEIEADRFVADPLTSTVPEKRQSALFKKSRAVLKRQAFAQSRSLIDAALAQPVTDQKYIERGQERAAELRKQIDEREHLFAVQQQIDRIGNEPTPAAMAASARLMEQEPGNVDVVLHRARLFRKGLEFDEAEALYVGLLSGPGATNPDLATRVNNYLADMRLRAAIVAIGDEPSRKAIAAARALSAQNPQSVDAAFHLAQLLQKDRSLVEAEAIYRKVLAEQGATDPEAADRAKLNLAQLYIGSNRLSDASVLLADFSADSSSPYVTGRIGDLGSKIDQKLAADRIFGFVSLASGYDSNTITRVDLLDQEADQLAVNKAASAFQTLDLNAQYRHVIDKNGNFVAVTSNLTHTVFNANPVGGIDRTLFDILVGPVYALPSIDSVISGGLSYRYRLRDYRFARQSPGVLLRLDQTLTRKLSVRTEALYERTDDNLPNRDGNSYEMRYQVRFDLTRDDELGLAIRARRDAASIDFEARSTIVGSLSYRQNHALVSTPGNWYWGLALNYTNLEFGGVNPLFNDQNKRRIDNNLQLDGTAGRDIGENWTVGARFSFLGRNSTVPRNDEDSLRFLLSVTRRY